VAHTPRVYVAGHLAPGNLHLDAQQSRRLAAVMRLREGDGFLVFCGDGCEWHATVQQVTKSGLDATVGALARQEGLPALIVEVWCGLVRPNRFDWAIEKCVEAGADMTRPLVSEFLARSESASGARQERWTRIAIEATEQSGRLFVAAVEHPEPFASLLARARHVPVVIAHQDGKSWRDVSALLPTSGTVALAIGPEGGFSPEEISRAQAHGALLASLGPNTLRTETAALVATALVRAGA
jgi:16S rRNA (uracil1498-N3)-methyltransferase